jgi:threonine synthase
MTEPKYQLVCAQCGHRQIEDAYYIGCPKCGGFVDVEYRKTQNFVDDRYQSIFRFHPVMPYDPTTEAITSFEDIEDSPQTLSEELSSLLGIELYLKNEMVMPTGTWKDREGFVSLYRLWKSKIQDLVVFSSGNTGTSLARSATLMKGPRIHLVVPQASQHRVKTYRKFFESDYVKLHFFEGSNDECAEHAAKLANQNGWAGEGGFSNYARREGLKLLALEYLASKGPRMDWYAQPVAGGIGIYSFYKAHRDLGIENECPKLLGVQAEICAPMVHAWRDGSATLQEKHIPQTVVPSDFVRVLRTRRPAGSYPVLKKIVDRVGGGFEDVSDRQIYDALRLFYKDGMIRKFSKDTGKWVGLEPATALAGVVKAVQTGQIRKGAKVLLNVSGAAKDGDLRPQWISDLL